MVLIKTTTSYLPPPQTFIFLCKKAKHRHYFTFGTIFELLLSAKSRLLQLPRYSFPGQIIHMWCCYVFSCCRNVVISNEHKTWIKMMATNLNTTFIIIFLQEHVLKLQLCNISPICNA